MPYIGTSPSNGVRRVHTYTATASQTTFTGASTEGVTLSYADTNYIDVFQNGVLLGSADYTSTSGTSVVLAQGASVGDLIVITVYDVFGVADTISKKDGGTFDGNVTMGGTLTVSGAFTSQGIDDNADATAITIDSSEKVGIGQTTPTRRLHIKDTSADMYIGLEGGTSNNVGILMGDTDNHTLSRIRHDNSDNALEFHTNETERMRIDTNGNVGIGTNAPGSFNQYADNLVVGTTSGENGITIATGTGNSARFVFSDNNNNSNDAFVGAMEYSHSGDFFSFYNGGNQRVVIADNGNITNSTGSYGTISDEKLKENISDASSQWADIKALQVRKYSMKADDLDSANRIGVIAQELEKSGMNGLVEETPLANSDDITKKETVKSVKYSILYMKAIKALQEAMARIETLEAEVKALKG